MVEGRSGAGRETTGLETTGFVGRGSGRAPGAACCFFGASVTRPYDAGRVLDAVRRCSTPGAGAGDAATGAAATGAAATGGAVQACADAGCSTT